MLMFTTPLYTITASASRAIAPTPAAATSAAIEKWRSRRDTRDRGAPFLFMDDPFARRVRAQTPVFGLLRCRPTLAWWGASQDTDPTRPDADRIWTNGCKIQEADASSTGIVKCYEEIPANSPVIRAVFGVDKVRGTAAHAARKCPWNLSAKKMAQPLGRAIGEQGPVAEQPEQPAAYF